MSSVPAPAKFMFGVEYEVLFWTDVGQQHYLRDQTITSRMFRNETFKRTVVMDALQRGNVQVYMKPGQAWDVKRDTQWKLEGDGSVRPDEDDERSESEDMYSIGLELSSPPLPLNSESISSVLHVANILKSIGGELPASTGFHVHISMPGEWPLEYLKSIFCLCSVAFKQFRQFHSQERVLSSYCVCPSVQYDDATPVEIEKAVASCTTMEKFFDLVHMPLCVRQYPRNFNWNESRTRYTAINFLNIRSKRQNTIEFRTHCGTLDLDAVTRWVRTCEAIVEVAPRFPRGFAGVMAKIENDLEADGRNYTAIHLLRDLGKPEIAAMWAGHLHLHTWGEVDVFSNIGELISLDEMTEASWPTTVTDSSLAFEETVAASRAAFTEAVAVGRAAVDEALLPTRHGRNGSDDPVPISRDPHSRHVDAAGVDLWLASVRQ